MFLLLLSRELYNSYVATLFLNASGVLQLLQRISGSLVAIITELNFGESKTR